MSSKWDHINAFIKEKNNHPKRKQVFKEEPISLKAQVIKPVKRFDYKIESFFGYLYYSFVSPQSIARDEDSSKYFLFSLLNVAIYLLLLMMHGVNGLTFQFRAANQYVLSHLTLALVVILLTFFIQLFSLNNKNTIYKIFVDTISYYTPVMMMTLLSAVLKWLDIDFVFYIELLTFVVMMMVPMRLFMTYHEKYQFDVDVFTLNVILCVLIIVYMIVVRNNDWFSVFT